MDDGERFWPTGFIRLLAIALFFAGPIAVVWFFAWVRWRIKLQRTRRMQQRGFEVQSVDQKSMGSDERENDHG